MASLNEILVGRFNGLLTRLLKISGGAPAPQLTPEVTPVLVLIGDDPENRFLKEEQLYSFGAASGNAATKNSYVQLANPANSGLLIIVEYFIIANPAAAQGFYLFGITTPSSRAAQTIIPRDSRLNPGLGVNQKGPGVCTFGTDLVTDGIAGTALQQPEISLAASDTKDFRIPYVLQPGDAFTVWASAANVQTLASIFWRARAAQQSERV